jgi:hypothetical protein
VAKRDEPSHHRASPRSCDDARILNEAAPGLNQFFRDHLQSS